MKIFNLILVLILVNLFTNETYGEYYRDINNNLCDENWWKTVTIDELDSELTRRQWDINNDKCDVPSYASSNEKIIYIACSNSNNSHIIKYLIDKGTNINIHSANLYGATPLLLAARLNNSSVVDALIKAGAKIDAKNDDGNTVLQSANMKWDEDVIDLLISSGADVNNINNAGESVLMSFIKGSWDNNEEGKIKKYKIIKKLIDSGADVNYVAKDSDKLNDAYDEIYRITPLMSLIRNDNTNKYVLDLLLENGADVSIKDKNGRTALFAAISSLDINSAQTLIDKGANIKDVDNEGNTLLIYLHNSIYAKVVPMIKFLLKNGLNIDSANNKGETALIKACQQGKDLSEMQIEFICSGSNKQEFITALLDNGANVNIKDNSEKTALDYAEENPIVRCSDVFYRLRDLTTNKVN